MSEADAFFYTTMINFAIILVCFVILKCEDDEDN